MMTKEEITMVGFEIVAYSGEARSKLLLALEKAKEQHFDECNSLIEQANDCLNDAHPIWEPSELWGPKPACTRGSCWSGCHLGEESGGHRWGWMVGQAPRTWDLLGPLEQGSWRRRN